MTVFWKSQPGLSLCVCLYHKHIYNKVFIELSDPYILKMLILLSHRIHSLDNCKILDKCFSLKMLKGVAVIFFSCVVLLLKNNKTDANLFCLNGLWFFSGTCWCLFLEFWASSVCAGLSLFIMPITRRAFFSLPLQSSYLSDIGHAGYICLSSF